MSAMVAEIYDALRSVGVDEPKAKAAAIAMFDHKRATRDDVSHVDEKIDRVDEKVDRVDGKVDRVDGKVETLDKRLIRMEKEIQFMKWCISGVFVMMLADFIRGFLA